MLTTNDHRRDVLGLKYVYPVVSRRAGGVSVGINLNVNNACNWACRYCQVPDLTRGGPPPVDLEQLESELRLLLTQICHGSYLDLNVPAGARKLVDLAFSGNGEPTSSAEFLGAVETVIRVHREFGLDGEAKLRLITNGSFLHRARVREGIARLGQCAGEIWFKVDRATSEGVFVVNGVHRDPARMRDSLTLCAELAETWIQTCLFAIDGVGMSDHESEAYLAFIRSVVGQVKGVLLYGLARPSLQPGAERLTRLPESELHRFAENIAATGMEVVVSP